MIAKLIIFVLKSSLFILNLFILTIVSIGCSSAKKQKSTSSNMSLNPAVAENSVNEIQTVNAIPPGEQVTDDFAKTPESRTVSRSKTPSKKEKLVAEIPKEPPKEPSLKRPKRSLEAGKMQKTMRGVQEVDAKGIVTPERSTNQEEFDDYLNKLGEK